MFINYVFTPLCYVRFVSGIIALGLVWFLWKRRHSQGAIYLLLFQLSCVIWAVGDGLGAAGTTLLLKLLWAQVAYIGITISALLFLLFALSYTNHTRLLNLKTIAVLMVIPILTIIMAFTNPLHNLLWSRLVIPEGTNLCVFYYGPWFWINVIYEYSALTIGIIVLIIGAFKVFSLYKIQLWILIAGTLLPFVTSITYVFKLTPFKGIDPTSIAFIISGCVIAFSLYSLRMFNIMPIARKQAIDNLNDGMLILDSENLIVDANPAFFSIFGIQNKEIIGKQSEDILSDSGINIRNFLPDNEYTQEISLGGAANQKNIEIRCHEVKDKGGKLIGRILMTTDVTTKKMILDAIADSNNRRRIELIEKEKLILDLDAYARSVAHDLKNPLNTVVGFSELIKISLEKNKVKEAEELIDIIKSQGYKMARIIDDLLMLSRIRKEDIQLDPIDVDRILHDVKVRLTDAIASRNATLEIPEHWPKVMGNIQLIEEVWVNLISNAIKYGGGPPVITLGFDKESEGKIRFWITDNGNGIAADSLQKVFDDFERLDMKDIQGHGLGLSIVKRIIEKLDGEVSVESTNTPGEGCKFSFTLAASNSV